MPEIVRTDANAKTVSALLKEKKYQIDYYQREYRWQTKHVEELISDLADAFLSNYDEAHSREDGDSYSHYFLGPIILSNKNGHMFIVDGQQRLTTLTLLLIFLNNLQKDFDVDERVKLDDYIFSEVRGQKSFNLQVPEREQAVEALYNDEPFDKTNQPESVQNIISRYQDIEELYPEELRTPPALLFFIDWLLYNVDLVEIVAFSDEEAYTIFETMNDRGLSLSPTAMLKSYLLSNIKSDENKEQVNNLWKDRVLDLIELSRELDVKNEEIEACKVWLRAKHAETIRERKRGAENQDFEIIGTGFHRWVRDNAESLGLHRSADFRDFANLNFEKFTRYYLQMRRLSDTFHPDFEYIYYNAHNNFTLQYMLALAPVRLEDDEDLAWRKIRTVTSFIDIYVARRMVNFKTLSYSSISYSMFILLKSIRDLDLEHLVETLQRELAGMEYTFDAVRDFRLHGQNRRHVRYLLARLTHFVETKSGMATEFARYINRSEQKGAKRYEVEHIWADKYQRHTDEFEYQEAFRRYRNRFGGLILLPRGFNQSYGDLPYEDKLSHYYGRNLLAQSLNPQCYDNNPNFRRFLEEYNLPFRPHEHFTSEDLDQRQELYRQLCEIIWDPTRLEWELQ